MSRKPSSKKKSNYALLREYIKHSRLSRNTILAALLFVDSIEINPNDSVSIETNGNQLKIYISNKRFSAVALIVHIDNIYLRESHNKLVTMNNKANRTTIEGSPHFIATCYNFLLREAAD